MFCHFLWFLVAITLKAREIRAASDSPAEIQLLNVDKVWEKGITGKGIVVAVVDNGFNEHHNDLKDNFNKLLSKDFVVSTTSRQVKSHGTRCAGVIAGKRNGRCRNGGGIAYNAQLADRKILNGSVARDGITYKALRYRRKLTDIYSNSWGPSDNGHLVNGPGPMVKLALEKGVERGRHGRGSIFVFSTGNGGGFQDSCAFDGYINSIYTIAIGAATKFRETPHYAEPCSSVMAAAYGDDVKTSDATGCVNNFGRTSAAAAMASGIIALLLEATKNTLTWRDVQHLIVRTSRPNQEVNNGKDWIVNGAGLMVHPFLGFGIMDANRLVEVARENWQTVPDQKSCTVTLTTPLKFSKRQKSFEIDTNINENCSKINHIEQVQVEFSLSFERRGLLQMYLESPHTTKSKLIYERMYDALTRRKTFNNLPVTSLHFWGESVKANGGKWKISFESRLSSFRRGHREGQISQCKVTFYGTEENPIRNSGLTKEVKLCGYGNKMTKFWAAYGNSCCGSLGIYDKSHLKCCDGVKIVQKYSVCGGHKYDQCIQICCDGKPHKKAEGATCCGKETYNIKTEICCKKRRVAKFRCKRVWSWRGYRYYLIFRNSEAVCHPYDRLYYRAKHDEGCRDPCADNPCKNRGRCHANIEAFTFTCQCSRPYRGKTCEERDPCAGDPCKNGGRCLANTEDLTFTCQCLGLYRGKTCEERDPCADDPCENGGRCVGNTEKFTFTCQCFEPYRGKTCEKRDPCAGDPCKNRGRCVGNTEEFTFTCLCFEPYRGKTCEEGALPVTCTSLRQRNSSATSGNYSISPSGSHSPVQVFCDMISKNGIGVTVIGHDSEAVTYVKNYEYPGSYKRRIRYDHSMQQIVAVISESTSCEQFIKYECYSSSIWNGHGTHVAWWVSRQGREMNYWGGAEVGSGKCACGMNNACADDRKRCNCDSNDNAWREDSGYLTDKNSLPVTELRFGDTGGDVEEGKHTMGKLRCWG